MKCKNCDSMEIHAKGLCKKCYSKAHYAANRDEIKSRYEANKDEFNARSKAYRDSHKDEINAKAKLYHEANKDEAKLYYETTRDPNSARMGSEEFRIKMSCGQQGIAIEDFDGFTTESKYCEKFNNECREKNRNKYDRECFICGKDEIDNGRKLSVHHVDMNKNQGCDSLWHACSTLCFMSWPSS